MLKLKFLFYFYLTQEVICSCTGSPPPVKNFTTITLYTDLRTWNEAVRICEDQGGRILDITYYSLFSIMLTLASDPPWTDLPIANGPPGWIGLHRRITPLGDLYYSEDCRRLIDYKVVYWNTNSPYSIMDGDPSSGCVYHQINKSTTSVKHDFTRAHCEEPNRFYCMSETGPCTFERVSGTYGDSSQDFTPSNDETHPYESVDQCADLCLNSWSIYSHPNLRVVEECWGFTTSATECLLHNVLKPSYFDKSSNKIASPTRTLFIKRCFSSAVNTEVIPTPVDTSSQPNTTCGTPVMGNSTVMPLQVSVYLGRWTWNEAFRTCKESGLQLLKVQHQDDYIAIQQLVNKYAAIQSMDYVWLGLHEPDPVNHTDTRVWSDCSESVSTNWDPSVPPSSSITDTSLCTVLDTSSKFWYTIMCNEQHYFICTGDYEANHSYDNGISNTVGVEISPGPYHVTGSSCRDMCSTLTYENQECWGYATLTDDADRFGDDSDTECFLYFVNSSNPTPQMETGIDYTLFVKMTWSDTLLNRTGVVDSSLVPSSCCDVTGLKSECPENSVPVYSATIPTTGKLQFVLYRTLATWNEALSVCTVVGGTLVQVNDVSKLQMLRRYMDTWNTDGYITDEIWIGLSQLHLDDPCSLRWAGDCSRPTWTDFTDGSYTDFNMKYCTAVDQDFKYVKRSCDQQLQFVCEVDAGACDTDQVVIDINCNLGPQGALLTRTGSTATCLTDCQFLTYQNMECWAVVIKTPNACNLVFYVDPEYCKDDSITKKDYHVHFKTCFSAIVIDSPPFTTPDVSIFPKTSCSNLMPIVLSAAMCDITTSTTSTSSTTLPIESSSVSPSVSASTTSVSLSVSASSTTVSQPVSESTLMTSTPVSIETSTPVTLSASLSSVNPSVTLTSSTETSVTTGVTSAEITSSSVSPTTTGFPPKNRFTARPIFIWPCLCYTQNKINMTSAKWHEWFILINSVDRHNTSRYRRKLTSVADDRTSSITIALIASSVLVALALCLIVTDIPRIAKSAAYIHGNQLKKKQRQRIKK